MHCPELFGLYARELAYMADTFPDREIVWGVGVTPLPQTLAHSAMYGPDILPAGNSAPSGALSRFM